MKFNLQVQMVLQLSHESSCSIIAALVRGGKHISAENFLSLSVKFGFVVHRYELSILASSFITIFIWCSLLFKLSVLHHATDIHALCLKNIPDIFDCNVKKSYHILLISSANISDTTYHQMTV